MSPPLRGILLMTLAATGYSLTAVIVRRMSAQMPAIEIVFWRTAVGLCILAPWLLARADLRWVGMRRLPLHLLRGASTTVAMFASFWALANMPIAEVYALQFSLPLFAILLSVVLLGERAGVATWIACAVGLAGTLLILRPGFTEIGAPALAALASAAFYAVSNVMVKVLARIDGPDLVTAYGNLFILPCALVPALYVWTTPGWDMVPWVLAVGVVTTLSQVALARAVTSADARVVWPFDFLKMPIAVALGFAFFAELPGPWTWAGAMVIFAAAYYVLWRETGRRRASAPGGTGR